MEVRGKADATRWQSALFHAALLSILAALLAFSVYGPFAAYRTILIVSLLAGGMAWLVSVELARRGVGNLGLVVAGAIALRIVAWSADARLSDDAFRYLWEGEVVIEGASPYAHAPADRDEPVLENLRRRFSDLYGGVNHKEVRAAYPPLAQAAGAAIASGCRLFRVEPETAGVRCVRVLFGLCDLLILWPLSILLERARLPAALTVVWGWCPVAAIEFAGSGHLDSLGILLLLGALAGLTRVRDPSRFASAPRRGLGPAALLAAGILTKYIPAAALPGFARGRGGVARIATVLALCALGFAPFLLLHGSEGGLFSGLGDYAFRWESTSLVHRWIERAFGVVFALDESGTDPRRLARAVSVLAWLALAARVTGRERDPVRGTGILIGAWLVLSPTLHPWYLCWVLPFVALRPCAAWLWLIMAAPVLYWPLAGWQREGRWSEPAWLWPLVALPFFALLARDRIAEVGSRGHSRSPLT